MHFQNGQLRSECDLEIFFLLNSGSIDVAVNSLPFPAYLLTLDRGDEKCDNNTCMVYNYIKRHEVQIFILIPP